MKSAPDRSVLAAFALVVIFAGSNAVAARFTLGELQPFWSAALRFAAAAIIFWALVFFRRVPLPRGRALLGQVLYGLLAFGVGYALMYWGLQSTPAGLLQVILALVPLLTFFAAFLHGLEPFRLRGLLGALLAVAGIAWAFFDRPSSQLNLLALLSIVAGAACFAESSIVVKLFPRSSPLAANAVGFTAGALLLFVISLISGETWNLPVRAQTLLSMLYLVVFGTVLVFYLFLYILARWTASATSYQFVLLPFVTVVVGSWLAGEAINPGLLLGGGLVLLGVYIGVFSGGTRKAPAETEPMAMPGGTAEPAEASD